MGALFKKPKIPDIKVNAPAIENPVLEPEAPELGAEESEERKKNKGKKALRIDYVGSARGTNPL
jgi:hypothetical protein